MNTPRRETGAGRVGDIAYKTSSFNPNFAERVENALAWDQAGKNVQREMGIKDEKPYQGHSATDTDITRRITAQTFSDSNSSDYRQALAMRDFLEDQKMQLEHDAKMNIRYAKELKNALSSAL